MEKYILITGGAGFIGGQVVNDLFRLKKNLKIIIIDNLSSGKNFIVNKRAKFLKINICNYKLLSQVFKKYKISTVFHFAAKLSVSESQKKIEKYFLNNVNGTENLLKLCEKHNVKKFIFSSTCAVYGDPKNKKVNESTTLFPKSNYGKTKLLSEEIIKQTARKISMKYAILRYFNVMGADPKSLSGPISRGTLFKELSRNLVRKSKKINLHGSDYPTKDGTCIRDYIDVNDLSKLHILSYLKLKNFKNKSFIVNCGYGLGLSVKEIIHSFERVISDKIKIIEKPRRPGDAIALYCNTNKLKKLFPLWKRKFSLEDSIHNSIKWEKRLFKLNKS